MAPRQTSQSPLVRLGSRWGQWAGLYTFSNVLGQVIGFATTILITYFVPLSTFGTYAIAVFFASMVTIVINAGSLQGTMIAVFSQAHQDAQIKWADPTQLAQSPFDRRRLLSSVLLGTALVGAAFVCITAALAGPLSSLMFRQNTPDDVVVLAALSGATGAVWRLAVTVLRMERRVGAFCFLRVMRPVVALIAIVILLAAGAGISGALIGLTAGSVVSFIPIIVISRRNYRPTLDPRGYGQALRRGVPYVSISICQGFVHTAGVYILRGYHSVGDVGEYSIATSFAQGNASFVSGFNSSFSPMRRTSTFAAASQDTDALRRRLIIVWLATSVLLFVSISLLADQIVRVFPRSYAGAAGVVPYAMLGWTAWGFYMLIYRLAEFRRKRRTHVILTLLTVGFLFGFSALFDPRFGAPGQGVALGLTYVIPIAAMLRRAQRSESPLPLEKARIIATFALGAVCVVGFTRLANELPGWRLALELAGTATYLASLLLLRIVPLSMVRRLWEVARSMLPKRHATRDVSQDIDRLPPLDAKILRALSDRRPPAELAAELGVSEAELDIRAVAGLRVIAGLGGPRSSDVRIGAYLLAVASVAERDVLGRALWKDVDPGEIDILESTLGIVRRAGKHHVRIRVLALRPAPQRLALPEKSAIQHPVPPARERV